MSPKDNNNNSVFTINMNEIFPPEWYADVESAIDFALKKLGPKVKDPESLVKYIMDYNINERIDTVIRSNLVNTITNKLNWIGKDYVIILSELYAILDCCAVSPTFESYKARVKLEEDRAWYYNIEDIGSIIKADYPNLTIKFSKLKTKNQYNLTITKTQSSKK